MTLAWSLRVQIEDGCNFDFGFNKNESVGGFFRCVFNKCVNQSSIVRLPTFLSYDVQPVWNEALEWQFDDKTLKKLKKSGSSIKLQLFIIKDWDQRAMSSFPVSNFTKNRQKYNIQQIGYIVLDLKNALSIGTKIKNFDDPQIDAKYLKIRNVKIMKNKGIYPQTKISFWCALQPKWDDNPVQIQSPEPSAKNIIKPPKENAASKQNVKSSLPKNTPQTMQIHQAPKREIVIINEEKIKKKNEDMNQENVNDDNIALAVGNKWFCVIHKMEMFIDIPNIRLMIVSMNERFILNLPLNETQVKNNEFCNDYPHFSWYLQSKVAEAKEANEWNTIASYSANIHEFVSNNHSKTYSLKLCGSFNKCIAKAIISISWEPFTANPNPPIIHEHKIESHKVASSQLSEYSSFSAESDHLHEDKAESVQISEINYDENDIINDDDEYVLFNTLNEVKKAQNVISDVDAEDDEDCCYKYRIGIDIRSIRDLRDVYNVQCKYKYQIFDNNRLFQSNPPILVNKSEEQTLTDGFCAYEIILKAKDLRSNLSKYPLIIQCIHRDEYTTDQLVGYCFINLYDLYNANKTASNLRYNDKYYTIYSIKNERDLLNEVATNQDLRKINFECRAMGNLRVCCSLEDFKLPSAHNEASNDEEVEVEVKEQQNEQMTETFVKNAKYLQAEIVQELKTWKFEQQEKWQKRWKKLEAEKLNKLEQEWKKNEEVRCEQLNRKKLEIIKLEKKLKTSLYDIECQEKKLKLEQFRIEDRKRELEQSYKLKTKEVIGSIKRLRNDNKMEIETLNRTIGFLKNENELISTKYRNEEKRCNDFRNELNKNRKQYDLSSIGQLQIENNTLKNKIDELNDKLSAKGVEIGTWKEKCAENEVIIKDLQKEMVENEKRQIDKEKKQMEKLKLELMTKSHFKSLRNDRSELQQIKNKLNSLMMSQQ